MANAEVRKPRTTTWYLNPSFPPEKDAVIYILVLSDLAFLLGSAEVVQDNAARQMLRGSFDKDD